MKITVTLPDTFDAAEWDYKLQPVGEFLAEVEQALYFTRGAASYHRTCPDCGAHIHGDLRITEEPDGEFKAVMLPRETCPRCESRTLGVFTDPVFTMLDAMTGINRERLEGVLAGVSPDRQVVFGAESAS